MKQSILYVGLDVHNNSIAVALAEDGRESEVRYFGTIGGDMAALDKVVRKLVSRGKSLRFVYEAGPCGYELHRHPARQGFDCTVVGPGRFANFLKNGDWGWWLKPFRRCAVFP